MPFETDLRMTRGPGASGSCIHMAMCSVKEIYAEFAQHQATLQPPIASTGTKLGLLGVRLQLAMNSIGACGSDGGGDR